MTENQLERRTIDNGDMIFDVGSLGHEAYIVQSGSVLIFMPLEAGAEKRIAVISPGNIIGEMALVDSKPRAASARALEETVIAVIPREAFEAQLKKSSPIVRNLMNVFVNRIREQTEMVVRKPDENAW